jgi:hypothetical protein
VHLLLTFPSISLKIVSVCLRTELVHFIGQWVLPMYRCNRNRKRSKRRGIFCPNHECYLESLSKKYSLFADQVEQLRDRGINRQKAQILLANRTTVALSGEWLEEFWCSACQCRNWYYVRLQGDQYQVSLAPRELWRQVSGVIDPLGNVSVGEFTRNSARRNDYQSNGNKSLRWSG